MLYKHGLAQTVYLELMQQKKPLELIFKLYEVTKPNMLYKHGLDYTVYLELMQQKKPLELIFKFYEVLKLKQICCKNNGWPVRYNWSS